MDAKRKRLRYQSWHRGCKETDDILGPFADIWLPKVEETKRFEALLEEDDWDIYRWLTAQQPMPEEHQTILNEIIDFQAKRTSLLTDVKGSIHA